MKNYTSKTEKIKSETFCPVPVQFIDQGPGSFVSVVDIHGEIFRSHPCLYSNNSIENSNTITETLVPAKNNSNLNKLTPYHKKQAQTLYENVERLIKTEAISINHVAFLTLTFKENITDPREAYRRFRSFNTNFLAPHPIYGQWVNTKEHQVRGAWHYHMIITLSQDIKTGFDFDLYDKWLDGPRISGTFPTGSKELRSLWVEMTEALEKYNFGKIFTLEPIKSNEEALGRYIGKYISKHISKRTETDKGVRLINYSKGWIKNSPKRAWHTENAQEWRKKVSLFARMNDCQEYYQLSEKLGSTWAYKYQDQIFDIYEKIEEIKDRSSKDFESPTLKRIREQKDSRESNMVKNLTIHHKIKKKGINYEGIIIGLMSQERIEKVRNEVKEEMKNRIYRQARNEKRSLERKLEIRSLAKEFGIEINKSEDIEGVPF